MPPLSLRFYCTLRGAVYRDHNFVSVRYTSATTRNFPSLNENFLTFPWWRKKFLKIQLLYDEVTGLKEVHDAQSRVIDAEKNFVMVQEERRKIQSQLSTLQKELKKIYAELDKTPRGEERYVQLITMEHSVIKEEKMISEVFHEKEREERDHFSALSSAVKMGHEKERAQAERTKYWSIIGSVFGTLLGMVASSIMNDLRMRELRNIVSKSVNMDGENRNEYTELLNENKVKLELLLAYIQKLSENVNMGGENRNEYTELLNENKDKLELLLTYINRLNKDAVVRPEVLEFVDENGKEFIPHALTAFLVVSGIVICIKLLT